MDATTPVVYVVDDDPDVLKGIERLLSSVGLNVATFSSPNLFLECFDDTLPSCLVLDLALQGSSGLELQRTLEKRASALPIVFLSGQGDIPTSVQAMKRGATDFLTKPVDDGELLAAIRAALDKQKAMRLTTAERDRTLNLVAGLTARERQVLERVVTGRLNKQIAAELGTVEKTIKFHRANLMRKLGVNTIADLVKLAERAGVGKTQST